jgi:hypothetical protein
MTFGNMRANGVRDLRVYCATNFCHHQAIINVDGFADDLFIVDIDRRLICTACGAQSDLALIPSASSHFG